jgi:hypothetical protein
LSGRAAKASAVTYYQSIVHPAPGVLVNTKITGCQKAQSEAARFLAVRVNLHCYVLFEVAIITDKPIKQPPVILLKTFIYFLIEGEIICAPIE